MYSMGTKYSRLGLEIKEILSRYGWSQQTLADYAGIGSSGISKIIRGKTNPSAETIYAIAKALSVDPTHLMRLSGIPLPQNKVSRDPSVEYIAQRLDELPKNMRKRAIEVVGTQIDLFYEMWESQKQLTQLTGLDTKNVNSEAL